MIKCKYKNCTNEFEELRNKKFCCRSCKEKETKRLKSHNNKLDKYYNEEMLRVNEILKSLGVVKN